MINSRHFNNKLDVRYVRVWNGYRWLILDKEEDGACIRSEDMPDLRVTEISIEEANKLRSNYLVPIIGRGEE